MNTAQLTVIHASGQSEAATRAERIRRLQAEAQNLARDHLSDLERALETVTSLAAEIADGGDAYPAGARDLCRRLAEDASWRANTLSVIVQKN
jgi:hypothetical protein